MAAIRFFGQRDRIGIVHFRNVRVESPYLRYIETFHDNGDCDMFGCVQALHDVGYNGTFYSRPHAIHDRRYLYNPGWMGTSHRSDDWAACWRARKVTITSNRQS